MDFEGMSLKESSAPLYPVYVDDVGEVHIVSPMSRATNPWNGKAFFLGYTTIPLREADGYEVPLDKYKTRLRAAQ